MQTNKSLLFIKTADFGTFVWNNHYLMTVETIFQVSVCMRAFLEKEMTTKLTSFPCPFSAILNFNSVLCYQLHLSYN